MIAAREAKETLDREFVCAAVHYPPSSKTRTFLIDSDRTLRALRRMIKGLRDASGLLNEMREEVSASTAREARQSRLHSSVDEEEPSCSLEHKVPELLESLQNALLLVEGAWYAAEKKAEASRSYGK